MILIFLKEGKFSYSFDGLKSGRDENPEEMNHKCEIKCGRVEHPTVDHELVVQTRCNVGYTSRQKMLPLSGSIDNKLLLPESGKTNLSLLSTKKPIRVW